MLKARLSAIQKLDVGAITALDGLACSVRSYDPGQYLLREGDRPKVCTLLLTGFIYRHKIVGDGGRQIVAVCLPGDLMDIQQLLLLEADHNIQALTEATVATFPSDDLIGYARGQPTIALALWHLALIEASITREWVANIGRRDARARTAHLLCELAIRCEFAGLGDRQSFELPMTQEQLGDTLGLTAVHVNRTLKSLETDGVITRNKRSIVVADWKLLREVGDFTSTYLHLKDEGRSIN